MQTVIPDFIKATDVGKQADDILRTCVHCGFCLATCPTYHLLGNELDSPRGRIYLIKQVMEGREVTDKTQLHLDRCLTCRNCETTCPSGVKYGHLLDVGRQVVEQKVGRKPLPKLTRWALRTFLSHERRVTPFVKLGQWVRPVLPGALKKSIPEKRAPGSWPAPRHARRMLVLQGCVQPAMAPQINAAAARVLDRLGISLVVAPQAGCCGAVSYHLNAHEEGANFMRRNVDAWWPYVEEGVEAIVMTASGCGAMVRDYAHVLRTDPDYAEKARRITELTRDLSEILAAEDLVALGVNGAAQKVAYHPPCTLQHGQQLAGVVEDVLQKLNYELTPISDKHFCCGSAGTYSIFQKELAQKLLKNKVEALESGTPDVIASANIGCLLHIQTGTRLHVRHWIELLDVSRPS